MIKVNALINLLKKNNCNFFTGVPDSVLKELSFYLKKKTKKQHIITSNEGSAVALGVGYYLSTKKLPVIYMQNSGLSNAINPLISIAHKKVYSIPMILIIGWRGSPRLKNDEPQHNVKGLITEKILKLLNIRYSILRSDNDLKKFEKHIKHAKKKNLIVAGLIEQGTLLNERKHKNTDFYQLDKELFLKTFLENLEKKTKIISSTGYNSRELMYLGEKYNLNKSSAFYMVGGMGHTTSVSLGYSLFSKKKVVCIDGDGSFLMHLGSIKTIGTFANNNFKYVLLNNNSHDSVGGQRTYSNDIDFEKFSKSLGFKKFYCIKEKKNLKKIIKKFLLDKSLSFLEVKVTNNKSAKLPRPSNLIKIKKDFMKL